MPTSHSKTQQLRQSVCMLVTSGLHDDPRVSKEAASATEAGYDVTVICRSYIGGLLPYRVVPVETQRRTSRMAKYAERLWTNVQMTRLAVSLRPDIIHANDLDTLPAAYVASRMTRAKLVYDAHELWAYAGTDVGRIGQRMASALEKSLTRRVDAMVTVSESLAHFMAKEYGIPVPVVVMNVSRYVSPTELSPKPWVQQFAGKRIALFQGRYLEGRGLREVVVAGRYLPEDVVIVFRGFGPLESELVNYVAKEGLDKKVFFEPPVSIFDMVPYAVGADLGIFSSDPAVMSTYFAAPNKLFEYMMAGVPCVGTDTPDVRAIICGRGVGDVFRPKDPVDLARVIVALLENPDCLRTMHENCLQSAYQMSWEVEVQKLLQEYERILQLDR